MKTEAWQDICMDDAWIFILSNARKVELVEVSALPQIKSALTTHHQFSIHGSNQLDCGCGKFNFHLLGNFSVTKTDKTQVIISRPDYYRCYKIQSNIQAVKVSQCLVDIQLWEYFPDNIVFSTLNTTQENLTIMVQQPQPLIIAHFESKVYATSISLQTKKPKKFVLEGKF